MEKGDHMQMQRDFGPMWEIKAELGCHDTRTVRKAFASADGAST